MQIDRAFYVKRFLFESLKGADIVRSITLIVDRELERYAENVRVERHREDLRRTPR
jgi:hypothetical protein